MRILTIGFGLSSGFAALGVTYLAALFGLSPRTFGLYAFCVSLLVLEAPSSEILKRIASGSTDDLSWLRTFWTWGYFLAADVAIRQSQFRMSAKPLAEPDQQS